MSEPVTQGSSEQTSEPVTQGSSEQTSEPVTQGSSEQTAEPVTQGSSEQTAEPVEKSDDTTVLITKDKSELDQTDEQSPSNVHGDDYTAPPDSSDQTEVYIPSVISVEPAVIEKLTLGTLELFLPNLQKAKSSLNEVLHNQEVLIETIQQENAKFTESAAMQELRETMQLAKSYHTKLVNLKREMNGLMEKSVKLKRRAVKVQQQKQKEEITKVMQRERELEREHKLQARVAKPQQATPKGQGQRQPSLDGQGHTQQDTPPQGHT